MYSTIRRLNKRVFYLDRTAELIGSAYTRSIGSETGGRDTNRRPWLDAIRALYFAALTNGSVNQCELPLASEFMAV